MPLKLKMGLCSFLYSYFAVSHDLFSFYTTSFNNFSTAAGKLLIRLIIFMLCPEKTYDIITQKQVEIFCGRKIHVH